MPCTDWSGLLPSGEGDEMANGGEGDEMNACAGETWNEWGGGAGGCEARQASRLVRLGSEQTAKDLIDGDNQGGVVQMRGDLHLSRRLIGVEHGKRKSVIAENGGAHLTGIKLREIAADTNDCL